jgi:hypothetical protein
MNWQLSGEFSAPGGIMVRIKTPRFRSIPLPPRMRIEEHPLRDTCGPTDFEDSGVHEKVK